MRHTCSLSDPLSGQTCKQCKWERWIAYYRTIYDSDDADAEVEKKEALREITEARNKENAADEARMLRELMKGR